MQFVTEMAYPISFSFDELKKISSYAGKKKYIESHLEKIGAGSSRLTYIVDDEKVLKLAKNKKGLAQNEEEISKSLYDTDLFAKMYDHDDDCYWVEMEIAKKVKPSDVKRLYGVSFNIIIDFIIKCFKERGMDTYKHKYLRNEPDFRDFWNDFWEWEGGNPTEKYNISDKLGNLLLTIYEYFGDFYCNWQDVSDWTRLSNWGLVKRNGIEEMVIIDMGLSDEIWKTHYEK